MEWVVHIQTLVSADLRRCSMAPGMSPSARCARPTTQWVSHSSPRMPAADRTYSDSGDDLPRIHAELDHLQRHAPAHRFCLFGDIDDATAAFADLLEELVASEGLADGVVRGIVWEVDPEGGCRAGGGVEEVVGGVVGGEEGLEALAEGLIAEAGTLEEGGTLGGGPFEGSGEQGFFRGGVHRRGSDL